MKKRIILTLSFFLIFNNFSSLSLMGDETKQLLSCAIQTQGSLMNFFCVSSLPVQIVNELFKASRQDETNQEQKKETKKSAGQHPLIPCENGAKSIKKLEKERHPITFITLTTDSSFIRSFSVKPLKDHLNGSVFLYSYNLIFLIALSLSNLPNIVVSNICIYSARSHDVGSGFLFNT